MSYTYDFDKIIKRDNTDSVKYGLRKAYFGNANVLPMWVADMDFMSAPEIIEALQKRVAHGIYGYAYRTDSFYESIVQWNQKRHNWTIKSEHISFSPGIVPALNLLIMAFTEPGDKVIVQPPVYYPFFSAVKNHGRELIYNQLLLEDNSYRMDLNDLESKIDKKTKAIILSNPHNPTGNSWTKKELEQLADICIKHNLLIISDEIHSDLVFSPHKHTPFSSLSEEIANKTITCMAASKTFNLAGLSTAYLVMSNPELKSIYEKILDDVHVGAGNIFGNLATETAYNYGEPWLIELLEYLKNNINYVERFLQEKIPAIQFIRPQATYLLWLNFNKFNLADKEIKNMLINEAGLGFNHGPVFGPGGSGFQRMNVGCPLSVVKTSLDKLYETLENKNML